MKTFLFLLILAAFMQSSIMPINLVLIMLIGRSLVLSGKENLILAFIGGVLVGILQSENIGFWTLIFLIMVKLLSLVKRLPVSRNIFVILVSSALSVILVELAHQLFFKQTLDQAILIVEIVLTLPIYLLILFWEERFVVKGETRLKLRG